MNLNIQEVFLKDTDVGMPHTQIDFDRGSNRIHHITYSFDWKMNDYISFYVNMLSTV